MSISNHVLNHYFEIEIIIFRYDGENYIKINESKYFHDRTLGLGNLEGRAVTTGCHVALSPRECYVKTRMAPAQKSISKSFESRFETLGVESKSVVLSLAI